MKTITALFAVAMLSLASCTSIQQGTDAALDQAKGNVSIGFNTTKVDKGYEVSGHAATNIFGVEPYGSFKAGIRYNPKTPQEGEAVEAAK